MKRSLREAWRPAAVGAGGWTSAGKNLLRRTLERKSVQQWTPHCFSSSLPLRQGCLPPGVVCQLLMSHSHIPHWDCSLLQETALPKLAYHPSGWPSAIFHPMQGDRVPGPLPQFGPTPAGSSRRLA